MLGSIKKQEKHIANIVSQEDKTFPSVNVVPGKKDRQTGNGNGNHKGKIKRESSV